jgi:hypothetical protein
METELHNRKAGAHRGGIGGVPDWAALIPVGVVALGTPSQPVERLIGTQAAAYHLVMVLGNIDFRWRNALTKTPQGKATPAQP